MQTFLPYPNFAVSAYVLDRQRLGKQRLESYMITHYLVLYREEGWGRHPVVKMWRDHLPALSLYMSVINREWTRRGYDSRMVEPFDASYRRDNAFWASAHLPTEATNETIVMPPWLGDPAFHASHRSQLLEKDAGWYEQFGWTEEPGQPYVWPEVPDIVSQSTAETERRDMAHRARASEVHEAGIRGDLDYLETLGSQERFAWHEARKTVDPAHLNPYKAADRMKLS